MIKKCIKGIVTGIILFIILITIYLIMLTISYSLPNNKIRENVKDSLIVFENEEGFYYRPFFGSNNKLSDSVTLDNYTDSIILGTALDLGENSGENILKRVVSNYRYDKGDLGPIESLEKAVINEEEVNTDYTRYWFGIEAFLRPMLLICNYQTIRYINVLILFGLFITAIYKIAKKIGLKYAIAFGVSIMLIGFIIIPMSLQYMPVASIMIISVICIISLYGKKSFNKLLPYIFMIIGMTTAFMDLLTYPVITLGIPILLVMLLKMKYEKLTLKEYIILFLKICIIWAVSYLMTYFVKWVIASIILNKNVITDAINQFLFRADASGTSHVSKLEVISKNFSIYFNNIVLILFAIYLIVFVINLIKHRNKKMDKKYIIPLILASALPYVWYIILSNHSDIHSWMTYKIQSITLFGILSTTLLFIDDESYINKKLNKGQDRSRKEE